MTEAELEEHFQRQTSWEQLPPTIKKLLGNSKGTWRQAAIKYALKHQLRWKTSLVKQLVPDEKAYYLDLVKTSRESLMLYPYHLSDVLVRGLRIVPFRYYLDMLIDLMKADKSYDSMPNFTAVDCLQVVGIGRNQFIDIMNQCRKTKTFWKQKKNVIRSLLPPQPIPIPIDYWWMIHVGFVSEEDIRNCTPDEHTVIDLLIDYGAKKAGELDKKTVLSLYTKGLIYVDVPIDNDDQIVVPPLEGFVMNRVLGDYLERLLYKLFVSVDERTTIGQLAALLEVDVAMTRQAVSMYIRLGFAKKKNAEPMVRFDDDELVDDDINVDTRMTTWHHSWRGHVPTSAVVAAWPLITAPLAVPGSAAAVDSVDNGDNRMSTSLAATPRGTPPAVVSTSSPSAMASSASGDNSAKSTGVVDGSSLSHNAKRIAFLFDSTLTAYLMMGNLATDLKTHAVTMFEAGKLADEALGSFVAELDKVDDAKLTSASAEGDARRYFEHAVALRDALKFLRHNPAAAPVDSGDNAGVGVDLLRIESVNDLEAGARLRLLQKNYSLLVSMAPLSAETRPVLSTLPRHHGPPIAECQAVWMKLLVYTVCGAGPNTKLYPMGTRVAQIPSIFRGCDRVRMVTWQHDPAIVAINHLVATLNDALLGGPVMVQAFAEDPVIADVALPADDSAEDESQPQPQPVPTKSGRGGPVVDTAALERHPLVQKLQNSLKLKHTVGVVRMWRDPTSNDWVPLEVHFGLPLHDIHATRRVCEKIAKYRLFEMTALSQHTKAMRELSLRLLDFIAANQDLPLDVEAMTGAANAVGTAPPAIQLPSRELTFVQGVLS